MKKLITLLGFLSLVTILIPNSVFSQSDELIEYRVKGTITGDHFNGGVMWTIIEENKATTIAQWSLGRSLIHSNVLPTSNCEPDYSVCLEATVTDSKNSAAAKLGDKFIVKIDPQNKKQVIVGEAGFLENVEISLDIDKIYMASDPKAKTSDMTLKETSPDFVTPLRNLIGDKLFKIPINDAYAANVAVSDDDRARSLVVHFSNGLITKPVTVHSFMKFQLTSSTNDERGSLPTYKFSDKLAKPSFYLESLPTYDKRDFYKGVDRWMSKNTVVTPFDVSLDYVSGKGNTIYKWDFSDCELTGFGTYLQDIKNLYSFSNKEQAEIRERATFECAGLKLNIPK